MQTKIVMVIVVRVWLKELRMIGDDPESISSFFFFFFFGGGCYISIGDLC